MSGAERGRAARMRPGHPNSWASTAAGRHWCPGRAPDYAAVGPRIVRTHANQNFEDRTGPTMPKVPRV